MASPVPADTPSAGVPGRDHVTDAVAAILLLASLGLRWDVAGVTARHVGPLLVTILSVASLATHHAYRAGGFLAGRSPQVVALVRALANVPYLVLVGVVVARDLAFALGWTSSDGAGLGGAAVTGHGAAVVVGLGGATLAALPRAAENDTLLTLRIAPWRRPALLTMAVAAALVQVLGLVAVARVAAGAGWQLMAVVIVDALGRGALVAGLLAAVALGRDAWRPVLVVTGGTLVAWALFVGPDTGTSALGLSLAILALPVAAALGTAPGIWPEHADRRRRRIDVARDAFLATALLALFSAASIAVVLATRAAEAPGAASVTWTLALLVVLDVAGCAAALVGRRSLPPPGAPDAPTRGVFVALGLVVLAGLGRLLVAAFSPFVDVSWVDGLGTFGLPALAATALAIHTAGGTPRHALSRTVAALRTRKSLSGDAMTGEAGPPS